MGGEGGVLSKEKEKELASPSSCSEPVGRTVRWERGVGGHLEIEQKGKGR